MDRTAGMLLATLLVVLAIVVGILVKHNAQSNASGPGSLFSGGPSFDRASWVSIDRNIVQAFMLENARYHFANVSRETVYENASAYPNCFVAQVMPAVAWARPDETMASNCTPPVYAYAISAPVRPSTTLAPGRGVPPHVNGSYAGTAFGLVFKTPAEAHTYATDFDSYLWNNRVYHYTPTTNASRIALTNLAVTPAILWEYTGFYPSRDPHGGAWYNLTVVLMQRWNVVFVYREDSPHYKNYYALYYATADWQTVEAYDRSSNATT